MVGGFKIYIAGSHVVYNNIKKYYSDGGLRDFDYHFMSTVFERQMEVVECTYATLPQMKSSSLSVGGHLEGRRIGFDVGGSDIKVSAVKDGEVLSSEEIVWLPKLNEDINYHYESHDGRAADYDDWNLNGDIILFDDAIDAPIELSSMGIRVNKDSLLKQLKQKGELKKLDNPYCQSIMNNELPFTIGGGIGQSRLCMYYLQKKHIAEVQSSYWDKKTLKKLKKQGIKIL